MQTQVENSTFGQMSVNDLIVVHQNQLRTNSLKVAEAFGKRHTHVLEKIKALDCSKEFTSANFSAHDEMIQAGAVKRRSKVYEMTKDGFMFLVMGFTGKKAAQIKEAYINAFNEMAEKLFGKPRPGLSPAQQRHIQRRVAELAQSPGASYRSVYGSIKDRFSVGSYKDVPGNQYPELCSFLRCDPEGGEFLGKEPEEGRVDKVSRNHLYCLITHMQCLRSEWLKLEPALRSIGSPFAGRIHDHIQSGYGMAVMINRAHQSEMQSERQFQLRL